ncbi:MAG TPA: YceD family protein [Usitatibacter sp.]|nr:YceD family protein [Usitatibacter sp.]
MDDDDFLLHPDRLSAKPTELVGTFTPADLERLEEELANGEGELRYRISASLDPQRRKVVSCIIEGFVFLTCQSSLDAFRHEISIADRLVLVDSESQLPAVEEEGDEEDYLVADEPLDIRDLVEDAVLLSLPMVPRKPGWESKAGGAGEPAPRKESPFAALAALKKRK